MRPLYRGYLSVVLIPPPMILGMQVEALVKAH